MYNITEMVDGSWHIECRIQDGTERWTEPSRKEAVCSLISAARIMNGSYIREDDIDFDVELKSLPKILSNGQPLSVEDEKLLSAIKSKSKVVLDFDDFRIKYRITKEECDVIIRIREGCLKVVTV